MEADATPLPEGLTPHKLRHTFCSLLFANGHELPYVMDQLRHADITTTLRIYVHVMSHENGERDRLRALINGNLPDGADFWRHFGTSTESHETEKAGNPSAPGRI